jgi:hypothetical protein
MSKRSDLVPNLGKDNSKLGFEVMDTTGSVCIKSNRINYTPSIRVPYKTNFVRFVNPDPHGHACI